MVTIGKRCAIYPVNAVVGISLECIQSQHEWKDRPRGNGEPASAGVDIGAFHLTGFGRHFPHSSRLLSSAPRKGFPGLNYLDRPAILLYHPVRNERRSRNPSSGGDDGHCEPPPAQGILGLGSFGTPLSPIGCCLSLAGVQSGSSSTGRDARRRCRAAPDSPPRLRSVAETRRSSFRESQFLQGFTSSSTSPSAGTRIGEMPAS